jgi:hypothetical protein|tara:strand:- start:624 stop:959 length:336 start_codon:yes stop_codon:yes gene_type:complete
MGKKRFDYKKYNKNKDEGRKFFNKLFAKAGKAGKSDDMKAQSKKRKEEGELIWGVLTFIILLVIVLNNTLFSDKSNKELRLIPREVKVTGEVLGIAFIFFLFVYIIIAMLR